MHYKGKDRQTKLKLAQVEIMSLGIYVHKQTLTIQCRPKDRLMHTH